MEDNEKQLNSALMNEKEWKAFANSEVVNFLAKYSLQKISIDDGAGKKINVKINKNGEYIVTTTYQETR